MTFVEPLGFHNATREADGEWLLRYWKFFLVVFEASKQKYTYVWQGSSKFAVSVILGFFRKAKSSLLWSRCINTREYCAVNISCDLHMEHLNR